MIFAVGSLIILNVGSLLEGPKGACSNLVVSLGILPAFFSLDILAYLHVFRVFRVSVRVEGFFRYPENTACFFSGRLSKAAPFMLILWL